MSHLLKFCYLFLVILIFSCQPKEKVPTEDLQEQQEAVKEPGRGQEKATQLKNIVFFGNSLTAGYGLDTREAFPALIQNKLDSLGLKYNVINAGLSGETTC